MTPDCITMESWLLHFGYLAVLIGTALEGEAVLLTASFLAYRKYFSLEWVILAAGIGTAAGDHIAYFLGFTKGHEFLSRHTSFHARLLRFDNLVRDHRFKILFSYRFLYGLRNIVPFAMGLTKTPPRLFITVNFFMTFIWASSIALMGYYTAAGVEILKFP